jgi:hypothetical protein
VWRGGGRESSNEEKRELQQELTCLQDRRAVTHKHSARSLSLLGGGKRFAREVSGQAVTDTQQTLPPESSAVFPGSAACTPACHEWIDRS